MHQSFIEAQITGTCEQPTTGLRDRCHDSGPRFAKPACSDLRLAPMPTAEPPITAKTTCGGQRAGIPISQRLIRRSGISRRSPTSPRSEHDDPPWKRGDADPSTKRRGRQRPSRSGGRSGASGCKSPSGCESRGRNHRLEERDTAVPAGGYRASAFKCKRASVLTQVDTPSHPGHDPPPIPTYPPDRILRYHPSGTPVPSYIGHDHYPQLEQAHKASSQSHTPHRPETIRQTPVQQFHLPGSSPRHHRTWHSSGGHGVGTPGLQGSRREVTAIPSRHWGLPPCLGPQHPNRMQGVQRYPALFVAAPGPFWRWHPPSGYCSIRKGRGATGRGVEGVGRYLWCRETPGQRQTHG